MTDYDRIANAIIFIKDHFKEQPTLEQVAEQIHVSPFHFQRMFKQWAGVSPKKFLQFLNVQYAKNLLKQNATLSDASYETGLSGTSRLHDLFITIEGMTPGEYKNGGENLTINFSYADSPFGDVMVASTPRGICHLEFIENEEEGLVNIQHKFPNASFKRKVDLLQQNALRVFTDDWNNIAHIKLHLHGTPFQLKVWETLLRIPFGGVNAYSGIGEYMQIKKAERAIGSAIGKNPVAFLIPCHRVIRSTGAIGEYHWGGVRKSAILGWEAAKILGEYSPEYP